MDEKLLQQVVRSLRFWRSPEQSKKTGLFRVQYKYKDYTAQYGDYNQPVIRNPYQTIQWSPWFTKQQGTSPSHRVIESGRESSQVQSSERFHLATWRGTYGCPWKQWKLSHILPTISFPKPHTSIKFRWPCVETLPGCKLPMPQFTEL